MSLAPDTEIESHRVRAPLPQPARLTTVEFAPDSAVAQIESQLGKEKEQEAMPERSRESEQPTRSLTTPAKRGRKKKSEKKELEVKSGQGIEEVSQLPDTSRAGHPPPLVAPPDEKYCVDSKVFARYSIDFKLCQSLSLSVNITLLWTGWDPAQKYWPTLSVVQVGRRSRSLLLPGRHHGANGG